MKTFGFLIVACFLIAATFSASNFDRIVLGEGNYGEDPNTTADITGQNDEYISNYTNGVWDFGSATLRTTGVIGYTESGVDSFSTTSATDSVTLTTALGFGITSKVFVSQWNPSWSPAVDTAIYSGQVVITGAGLTKVVITRVKTYTGNGVTAVKSGAQYVFEVRKY